MRELTTGDVLEITDNIVIASSVDVIHRGGLSPKEFKTWLRKGVVKPIAGGKGQGRHHRFTFVQAVAITYGTSWWRSGLGLEIVSQIVGCLTGFDELNFRRQIGAGRRFVLPVPGVSCRLLKPTKQILKALGVTKIPQSLDLKYVLERVEKAMSLRPANLVGRTRGLASK